MCPQELQRLGREKKGGRKEKKKCKVQKDRLETTIPSRTKQILTQSSHSYTGEQAGVPSRPQTELEITEERQSLTRVPA